jgi:hypothetical protein
MVPPSPTLAKKGFGLNDGRLIGMTRPSVLRASEERTFPHRKTFFALSNFEQIIAQWSATRASRPKEN